MFISTTFLNESYLWIIMGMDRYGHTYITKEGKEFSRPYTGPYVLEYHYVENDGWTFMRRGAEEETHVTINSSATLDDIAAIIPTVPNSDVQRRLEKMITDGEITRYLSFSSP